MNKDQCILNIKDLINKKNLYHSIIFSCSNQNQLLKIIDKVTRIIICKNNSIENDDCELCLKYKKNILINLITIGDGIDQIKKEDIKKIIEIFSITTLENSLKKIYIIKNAENMNESAANAILKFLEEPPENVYALFLTNDLNQILQTIKSRCKVITIQEEQETEVNIDFKLLELIKNKDKVNILLYSDKFKKTEKKDQIASIEYIYKKEILKNLSFLAELFLDTIFQLKNSAYSNLILENFFIKIFEAV